MQNEPVLKKVSATQINLSREATGFILQGKFVGLNKRETVDSEGEVKTMHTLIVEDAKGERIKALADAGLRTALEDAMVVPGDFFRAVKGNKTDIGQGRTMNTWDIYQ